MIFYCIFELTEAFTTRLHQKNVQKPSKKAKNTAAGTNILPQKAKVLLFFPSPPPPGNLPFIHGCARVGKYLKATVELSYVGTC